MGSMKSGKKWCVRVMLVFTRLIHVAPKAQGTAIPSFLSLNLEALEEHKADNANAEKLRQLETSAFHLYTGEMATEIDAYDT